MASAFVEITANETGESHRAKCALPRLVEVIGRPQFEDALMTFLAHVAKAEQYEIFQEEGYEFQKIANGMRINSSVNRPSAGAADGCLATYDVRREFRRFASEDALVKVFTLPRANESGAIPISPRHSILVVGKGQGALFGIRMIRCGLHHQSVDIDVENLTGFANLLVSLVARHHGLISARFDGFNALASLAKIEENIHAMQLLSRREAEVCARILFGFSSREIAADLGIGKESVMTYRKRAYQHLEIASQRELMLWYFEQPPSLCAA
ncbi:helix-turn-helix transcriptional regulator [Aurantiacibacter zhengii]|nr:LuxR C-terminal-related transcriptional regulator [Aurantiacibacter zhengii]